jgi:hypothetical protein
VLLTFGQEIEVRRRFHNMTNLKAAIFFLCASTAGFGEGTDPNVEDWTDPKKTVCEIHGEKLTKIEVPILWGLPARPERGYSLGDQGRMFPYSRTIAYGGCVIKDGDEKRKRAYIHQCQSCVAGFHQWLAKNYPLPAHRRPIAPKNNTIYRQAIEETAEQDVAPQSATRPESKSEGGDKPQPESEARSR